MTKLINALLVPISVCAILVLMNYMWDGNVTIDRCINAYSSAPTPIAKAGAVVAAIIVLSLKGSLIMVFGWNIGQFI
jgi:hypothetical protein